MRLGLAKGPVDPEVIIYGRTIAESPIKNLDLKSEDKKPTNDFLKRPEPISKQIDNPIFSPRPLNSGIRSKCDIDKNLQYQTVYFDIETTGLDKKDEVIEIAIVDDSGKTLLDSLVKSKVDINPNALKIHGITKDMIADAPTLKDLEDEIVKLVGNKCVVAYKISFEMRFLTDRIRRSIAAESCCMLKFAEFFGRLNNEPWPYQWQTLKFASRYVKYDWYGPHHRALSDALACRAVWQYMMKAQGNN